MKILKHRIKLIHLMSILFGIIYLIFALIPTSAFWYSPGEVIIVDTEQGSAPNVVFRRHIKIPSLISYSTVTRRVGTNRIVCEGRGGPFTYKPAEGLIDDADLVWWSAGDIRCGELSKGNYWTETCWKVEKPFGDLMNYIGLTQLANLIGWILPPKDVCRTTTSFHVYNTIPSR